MRSSIFRNRSPALIYWLSFVAIVGDKIGLKRGYGAIIGDVSRNRHILVAVASIGSVALSRAMVPDGGILSPPRHCTVHRPVFGHTVARPFCGCCAFVSVVAVSVCGEILANCLR